MAAGAPALPETNGSKNEHHEKAVSKRGCTRSSVTPWAVMEKWGLGGGGQVLASPFKLTHRVATTPAGARPSSRQPEPPAAAPEGLLSGAHGWGRPGLCAEKGAPCLGCLRWGVCGANLGEAK